MLDDPLFESAWKKCIWAFAHGHQLQTEIAKALIDAHADPPFTTRQEYHAEFHGFSVRIASIRPVPPSWGLALGDVVGAYRASLDHLAWAIVERGKTPPAKLTDNQRRAIYFPIWDKKATFDGTVSRLLPGAQRRDVARVRKAQPYIRGQKAARFCLTTLRALSDADKHRTIQPVWLKPAGIFFDEVVEARDCIIRRFRDMRAPMLEVDTEIQRVYAKKTGPDPDVALKSYLAPHVAFTDGLWVRNFLEAIGEFLPQLLTQFSEVSEDFRKKVLAPGTL